MARRSPATRRAQSRSIFGVRPEPKPRETAGSYLSRLAFLHGRLIPDMKTETGIDVRQIDLGSEAAIRTMAGMCGMGHGSLARWSPRRDHTGGWLLHGQEMGAGQIERTFFRFCPACIAADIEAGGRTGPYMRAEWTVSALRTCSEHGLVLTTASPEREFFAPYDFARTVLAMVPEMGRLSAEAERPRSSPLEAYLTDRLLSGTKKKSWLDDLSFHAAADLSEVFGAVALHGKKVRVTKLTPVQRVEAGAAGYAVLAEGHAGIRRFLIRLIRETQNGKGVWGPQLAIGRINDFLDARKCDPGYAPAVEYIRGVVVDEVPLEPDVEVLGQPVGTRRVWNLRSLAREVGTTVPLLKKILVRNRYMSAKADFRASRSMVDTDKVRALVATLDDEILTLPGVMERTGLTRRHIEAIVQAGGFVSVTAAGKVYNAQHRFTAKNVDGTMETLLGGEVVDKIPSGMSTLADARHAAICTFSEVLKLVLEGGLSWIGYLQGAEGLDAILVPTAEVTMLTTREKAPGLTRIGVQRRTGLTQKPVQMLFERQIFDLHVVRNPVKRSEEVAASEESVDRFMHEHIALHALAKHHGVHFRRMKAIMEAAGIPPVFDPVEFHATFYPRQLAEGLDLNAIDPEDVVLTRRTRAESLEHQSEIRNAKARLATEVLRDAKGQRSAVPAEPDEEPARRWTRLGRSRRIKGEISRRRVPSRRWTAERVS
nr:TniQ family protein [Mangrovicella endophytica]